MSDEVVRGLDALDKALAGLAPKMQKNWMRGALRAGVKVQKAEAYREAPIGEPSGTAKKLGGYRGALRDSLRISTRARGSEISARLTAGGKLKKSNAAVFYPVMVEGGTKTHEIKPRGHRSLFFAGVLRQLVKHPGAKARPFMAPTLRNTRSAAVTAFAEYLRARFAKAENLDTPGPENY